MAEPYWKGERSRQIEKRWVVEGDLVLQTAAALGNGDADEVVDLPLLVDPLEGGPLLTGTSIAGALRAYLCAWEHGESSCKALFGGARGDDNGLQSPLIVEDAIAQPCGVEFRDGVRLAPESRTAAEEALFNRLLWPAGTSFPLRLELVIGAGDDEAQLKQAEAQLKQALATALQGFERGEIALGARKERGCGRVKVEGWRVREYSLSDPQQLLQWLEHGAEPLRGAPATAIDKALGVKKLLDDQRKSFSLTARFAIDGSLLTAGMEQAAGPDKVQIKARRANGETEPLLPGTSLAGALRMRALRIARALGKGLSDGEARAETLVREMFGPEAGAKKLCASRLRVADSPIDRATSDLVQARVSIDRFTGGALDSALFNAQPVFGGELTMELTLRQPKAEEIGLLLNLLKDLWTGDLALGGEINIGRGRLAGRSADLVLRDGASEPWRITAQDTGGLSIEGNRQALEDYVSKHLKDYFTAAPNGEGS